MKVFLKDGTEATIGPSDWTYFRADARLKVTIPQARELVKAWQAFGLWGAVVDYLDTVEGLFIFPYNVGVRVVMGIRENDVINEHLWAGRLNKAGAEMVRSGIALHGYERHLHGLRQKLFVTDGAHSAAEFRKP